MEELPETLKAEIEALDSLDARALKRRYVDIVADMPKCALSSVLRATIAYRLQHEFSANGKIKNLLVELFRHRI